MARLRKTFLIITTIVIMLFSTSSFGCAPKQTAKIYFDYSNGAEIEEMQYKVLVVGQPVGKLPKTSIDGKTVDFWIYEGKIITEETIWWYRADIALKAICLEENEYLYLFDLNGGSVSENFNFYLVHSITDEDFAIENPTKTMYNFLGWVENDGDTPIKNLVLNETVAGNKQYKAIWERNYSVTISLRSLCVEDGKSDYVFYNWRLDRKDPSTDIPTSFELVKGETLPYFAYKPVPQKMAFLFVSWVWEADETVVINENTIFSEEIFGDVKDIVVIIKTKHYYLEDY